MKSSHCPACGQPAQYEDRPTRMYRGTCSSCGGSFTVVEDGEGEGPSSTTTSDVEAGEATEGVHPAGPVKIVSGIECAVCGEPVDLRSSGPGALEAKCVGCGDVVRYVNAETVTEDRRGPPRERGRGAGRSEFAPSARPCRECGGPLRFSTDADGQVVGECASCGNRFTLPPRREGGFGGRPSGRSFSGPRRGPPGGFRSGGSRWKGRPGGDRGSRPPGRFARDSDRPRDDAGPRRERRRRRYSE